MTASTSEAWIRRFHPTSTARARLLCLPHAGGAASYFFPVSRGLSPQIEVLAVQYPGRQDRRAEPCVETVEELADRLVEVALPFQDKPLALFGHSLGASVAFELAARLEARGVVPVTLFVSGRRAPSTTRQGENAHLRDDAGLIAEIKQLAGTDDGLWDDKEMVSLVLPAIRNDYRAAETYRPEHHTRLTAPIHALLGDEDPKATVNEVQRWADHTTGGFDLDIYSGGHFYLNDHAPALIERIASRLTGRVTTGS